MSPPKRQKLESKELLERIQQNLMIIRRAILKSHDLQGTL